jgi:hypothetical protein
MLEMQQRIMAVETTEELTHLVGGSNEKACRLGRARLMLRSIRRHCLVPLSDGLLGWTSTAWSAIQAHPNISPTFQEQCHKAQLWPNLLRGCDLPRAIAARVIASVHRRPQPSWHSAAIAARGCLM